MVYFQYLPIQSEQRKTFFREIRGDSFRSESEYRISERSKIEKTLVLRQKHSIEGIRIGCGPQYGDLFPEIRHPKPFQVLRIAVLPQQLSKPQHYPKNTVFYSVNHSVIG